MVPCCVNGKDSAQRWLHSQQMHAPNALSGTGTSVTRAHSYAPSLPSGRQSQRTIERGGTEMEFITCYPQHARKGTAWEASILTLRPCCVMDAQRRQACRGSPRDDEATAQPLMTTRCLTEEAQPPPTGGCPPQVLAEDCIDD